MPDREKVIKGLEHCLSRYVDGLCDDCPYMGELDKSYMIPMKCKEIIMRDALALLKEQDTANLYKCQNCGTWVSAENVVRCKYCKYKPHCAYQIHAQTIGKENDWFCADGIRKD